LATKNSIFHQFEKQIHYLSKFRQKKTLIETSKKIGHDLKEDFSAFGFQ